MEGCMWSSLYVVAKKEREINVCIIIMQVNSNAL